MPLIILTGFPCCGKTTFAITLENYLMNKQYNRVILVNEESLHISKAVGYANSAAEKKTRGALKSAVDHALNADTVVIIDSLNYIKGYRYELYCISRSQRTPHCCVWVDSEANQSAKWNSARDGYAPSIFDGLRQRFERPNLATKWDQPLFQVNMSPEVVASVSSAATDLSSSVAPTGGTETPAEIPEAPVAAPVKKSSWRANKNSKLSTGVGYSCAKIGGLTLENVSTHTSNSDTPPGPSTAPPAVPAAAPAAVVSPPSTPNPAAPTAPGVWFSGEHQGSDEASYLKGSSALEACEAIHAYLSQAVAPVPNSSTVPIPHVAATVLYDLDRISQAITTRISNQMNEHPPENGENIPIIFPDYDRTLMLHRYVSSSEAQRYRRQFVKVNSMHPPSTGQLIGSAYIDFLSNQL